MKPMRKKGQTLIMTAIILPIFIGLVCGFAVDVGTIYFTHTRMQTAADAAVLAGAHCLPDPTRCSAVATTTDYAARNGIAGGEIVSGPTVGTAPDGNPDVSMTARRVVPLHFSRLIGVTESSVQVLATAEIGLANKVFNAFPVGLQVCKPGMTSPCPYSTAAKSVVTFGAKKNDKRDSWVQGPADWSGVELPSITPTNTLSTCPPPVPFAVPPVDPCISSQPGFAEIKALIDEANVLISTNHPYVVVPVVDWAGCNGRCPLNVYAFAEIQLLSAVNAGPNASYITGMFVDYVNPGDIGPGGGNNIGAFAAKLIE